MKDKKKSNGDHMQNGKQKRPPSPPPPDNSKKKKIEGPLITEIKLDEEEMNLEELIKQKVFFFNTNILCLYAGLRTFCYNELNAYICT